MLVNKLNPMIHFPVTIFVLLSTLFFLEKSPRKLQIAIKEYVNMNVIIAKPKSSVVSFATSIISKAGRWILMICEIRTNKSISTIKIDVYIGGMKIIASTITPYI